jgi:hypothetical protein
MLARVEDDTMKLGLLMEAAQAQQALAADTLERLREHAAGLDGIVRQEIRTTLIDETRELGEECRQAAETLRRLQRIASLRFTLWGVAIVTVGIVIPFSIAWCMFPTRTEVAALELRRDELTTNITRLTRQGGDMQLRSCGTEHRLCVRIDRSAPAYGEHADFLVVKGH